MAASFPTTVKSFTLKTDGVDDVQAAHINDLQDEVAAVETELLPLLTGWIAGSGWTYASASTFTVAGNVTALFPVGTKIKLTQTTVKYFYVVSASYGAPNTTVTVTGGSDYSLTNAAITSPYYSYTANPQGFPHWFAYTSTLNGTGGSAGTFAEDLNTARFAITGRTCQIQIRKRVTNVGSWSGDVQLTLPVVRNDNNSMMSAGWVYAQGGAAASSKGIAQLVSNTQTMKFYKTIGIANLQWSDMAANDWIMINTSYDL
jgi:hypothetical protein